MASLSWKMNPPKADELDYIHFLIAAQKVFTCTEAARCQPNHLDLLSREPPDTEALWEEARTLVEPEDGMQSGGICPSHCTSCLQLRKSYP